MPDRRTKHLKVEPRLIKLEKSVETVGGRLEKIETRQADTASALGVITTRLNDAYGILTKGPRWYSPQVLTPAISALAAVASVFISLAALSSSKTIKKDLPGQLKEIRDNASTDAKASARSALGQFALAQAKPSIGQFKDAIEHSAKVPAPVLQSAQRQAAVLAEFVPERLETWQAAAEIVNYRTEAGHAVSEAGSQCYPGQGKGADLTIPEVKRLLSGKTTLMNVGCSIDLSRMLPGQEVQVLVFANVDIYASSGQIPAKEYLFFHCRFHLNPTSVPSFPAQELLKSMLVANVNGPILTTSSS